MSLAARDILLDGWFVERCDDSSVRFARPSQLDVKRGVSRLMVAFGCLAVCLALAGVSQSSADGLWLVTWSIVVLFAGTAFIAVFAAVLDFRRARLGVFLEFDVRAGRVRGLFQGSGVAGQFSVVSADVALTEITTTPRAFEDRNDGAGFLDVRAGTRRLLAPDVPSVAALQATLARLGLHTA